MFSQGKKAISNLKQKKQKITTITENKLDNSIKYTQTTFSDSLISIHKEDKQNNTQNNPRAECHLLTTPRRLLNSEEQKLRKDLLKKQKYAEQKKLQEQPSPNLQETLTKEFLLQTHPRFYRHWQKHYVSNTKDNIHMK